MPPRKDNNETGTQQNVECTKLCGIYQSCWIPAGKNVESLDFVCGFCSAKEIMDLKREVELLKNKSQQEEIVEGVKLEERQVPLQTLQKPTYANAANILYGIKREEKLQKEKENNLVISGIPLSTHENDKTIVEKIVYCINGTNPNAIQEIARIGTSNEGKQLLKVKLKDSDTKQNLLKKAKVLRKSKDYQNVFINPDLTTGCNNTKS